MTKKQIDLLYILIFFGIGQVVTGLLFTLPFSPIQAPDSRYYLSAADSFPSSMDGAHFGYVGFVGLLRVGLAVGSGPVFSVVVNSIGVIAAALALLSLGRRYSGEIAGWLAATFYLLHPLINQWTRYVLTETLFFAGIVIIAYCLGRAIDLDRWTWPPLWLAAGLTFTLRPNGIVLLGAVITVLSLSQRKHLRRRLTIVAAAWATVVLLALVSPSLAATHGDFGSEAWKGTVVHGVPETSISMPAPSSYDPSNRALIGYALDHPLDVGRLGATRIWWELKQVRPWYSNELNLFLTVSMTALYSLAALGVWSARKTQINLIILSISVPFGTVIASTWAIWEGRFGWWFLVLWTVWAGIGANRLLRPLLNRLPITHPLRQLDARHESKADSVGYPSDGDSATNGRNYTPG